MLWGVYVPPKSGTLIKMDFAGRECGFLVLSLWMIYPSMDIFLKAMVTLSPFVFRRFETDMYSKTLALLSEIVSYHGITSI